MSDIATLEVKAVADAREERVFFKCPVGGFASLSPGICPKCGELLMIVGASPVSTDGYDEGHMPSIARTSANNYGAGVIE